MSNGVPALDLQRVPVEVHVSRGKCPLRTICVSECCPAAMHRSTPWCVEDFYLHVQLYKGKASILYSATCRYSRLPVALKLYRKDKLSNLNWCQVEREINLHSRLRHMNIIQLYGAFEDDENVYLVQEFAEAGDLYEELKRNRGRLQETRVAATIIYPCMLALSYLHSKGIIHRDIKSENIVIKADGTVKLADFGLSIDYTYERPVTRAGTLDMMAPEVLVCPEKSRPEENKEKAMLGYTAAVDAWAMGIVAFELLVGHPPFEKESRQDTYEHIMYRAPVLPAALSDEAKSFIVSALVKAVSKRPSVDDLLHHSWCLNSMAKLNVIHSMRRSSKEYAAPVLSVSVDCTVPTSRNSTTQQSNGQTSSRSNSQLASSHRSTNSIEVLETDETSSSELSRPSVLQWANSSLKSITNKLRSKPAPLNPPKGHKSSTRKKSSRKLSVPKQDQDESELQQKERAEKNAILQAQERLEQRLAVHPAETPAERPAAMPLPTLLIPEAEPSMPQQERLMQMEKDTVESEEVNLMSAFTPFAGMQQDPEEQENPTESPQEDRSRSGGSTQEEELEDAEPEQDDSPAIQAYYPVSNQESQPIPRIKIRRPALPTPKPAMRSLEGLILDDSPPETRPTNYRRVLKNTPAGLEADPESPPAYLARPWLTQRLPKVNTESPPLSPRAPNSPLVRRRRRIAGKMDSSASGSIALAETPKGFPSGMNSARSFRQTPKSNIQVAGSGNLSRFGVNSAQFNSLASPQQRRGDLDAETAEAALRRAQSAVPTVNNVARKLSLTTLNSKS